MLKARGGRRARSSARSSSTRSGGSTRASTPTSTSSTCRSTRPCRSAASSRRAGEVLDNAMPWLEKHADERFFAWLHFYDAHTPYDPPEPFRSRFRGSSDTPARSPTSITRSAACSSGSTPKASRTARSSSRLAITARASNEHGEATHGLFIYDATMRVPFIIRAPYDSMRGRRVSSTGADRGCDADGARSGAASVCQTASRAAAWCR